MTYLGDRVSAGGVCEAVVTSRTWSAVSCSMAADFLQG